MKNECTKAEIDYVEYLAYRYSGLSCKDGFVEELMGEGLVGLVRATHWWNETKGTRLTYYRKCINNAMRDYLRKSIRYENEITIDNIEDCLDLHDDLENIIIQKEDLVEANALVEVISRTLTKREHYVLFNHILSDEPETLRKIAKRFKCNKSSIARDKKRIKLLLKVKEE